MPAVEFEPTISAGERSQTYALDRAVTGTGLLLLLLLLFAKIELSLGGSSPHISTDKTNKNKYT
jgi:hypothetical protein